MHATRQTLEGNARSSPQWFDQFPQLPIWVPVPSADSR